MRFAYADPPYLGCAKYYEAHHPDAKVWDDPATHRQLIERLQDEYHDGWALSLRERNLRIILPMCPEKARVGVWLSERPRFAPKLAVQRYFEPVIWCGGRGYDETGSRCRDYVVTAQRKLAPHQPRYSGFYKDQPEIFLGVKPRAFCFWMFDLPSMTEFWMQYVPHDQVAAYEALGWRALGECSGHHGIYATQMRWDGTGPPPTPASTPTPPPPGARHG